MDIRVYAIYRVEKYRKYKTRTYDQTLNTVDNCEYMYVCMYMYKVEDTFVLEPMRTVLSLEGRVNQKRV